MKHQYNAIIQDLQKQRNQGQTTLHRDRLTRLCMKHKLEFESTKLYLCNNHIIGRMRRAKFFPCVIKLNKQYKEHNTYDFR